MTINVYRSIMPGEPDEVYQEHVVTVEQWVASKAPEYKPGDLQPISCTINGVVVSPDEWGARIIRENDVVDFRVVPFGGIGDALGFVFPFWGGSVAAANAAIGYITPDIPGQPGQGNQGASLEPADARANTARLGEGVPELFGRYIRYPDYLNQPRRLYSDKTTQVLRLMLCVGAGSYQIDPDEVYIGDTPMNDLAGIDYTLYEPGADLSGVANHENWYHSPEVGSTSSSAGIRLKGVTFDERTHSGSGTGSGSTLSGITVGDLWEVGLPGSIKMLQSITVTDPGIGATLIFNGNFQHLAAGLTVNIESNVDVNGTYVITTINGAGTEITLETVGGDPITDSSGLSGSMSIEKDGTEYKLTAINSSSSIDVERRLAGGAIDPDWTGSLPSTSMTVDIEWTATAFTTNRSGPFVACPENETTEEFEVDIFAPQGLGTVDGDSIIARARTIRIEWREAGNTAWNQQNEVVSAATRDQLGFTFTVNLPFALRPEVRISRIGGEDVSVTALDRLEFTALRAKLPTVTSYPGVTTMAVTITGSDEISSASNNRINVIAKRKLPEISGGAFTAETETRKISAAAAYVAKSLGYDDDQIDLAELEQLEGIWTPRGDTFDYVFNSGTAKDAIDTILRAGFAEMTLNTGVIKPVRDQPRTVFEDGYSPENMTGPLIRSPQMRQVDEADGVEIEYTDGNTWTTETINCFLPGDQGVKLDKVSLKGVTDRTRAWRIGMRRRRAQRYRRWTYSFETELDALNSEYLSYVPLLDDVPGYGKPAILEAISADRITVSEPLTFEAGKSYVIAYRAEDGSTVGPFPCTEGPDEFTVLVSIPEPWPAVLPADREPTHIYFGTTERWCFPALISSIDPQGPGSVSVQATNYDARVYADDDNAPS